MLMASDTWNSTAGIDGCKFIVQVVSCTELTQVGHVKIVLVEIGPWALARA